MVNSDLVQLTFTGTTWIEEKKITLFKSSIRMIWKKLTKDILEVNHTPVQGIFTSLIRSGESSVCFISVCAEHDQQLVALRDERRRMLPATPASHQSVRLAIPIINCDRVIVALI